MAVTIKDVAKEAGVSIATVSKVLNDSPTISDATSEKVKEVMKKLHYQPNVRARNFASQSTRNIVFVANMNKNSAFENPHMFEMMSGLQKTLSDKKYVLQVLGVTSENCYETIEDMIAQKVVDAIILHVSVVDRNVERVLMLKQFPHLVIGCPDYATQLCWIDNNNRLSGEIAAKHVLDLGYKTMAFIGGQAGDLISTHRLEGVKAFLSYNQITLPEEYIVCGESSTKNGYTMMQELILKKDVPKVIVCANNVLAFGCVQAIKEAGYEIPIDFCVITFDDYPFSKIIEPELTVVNIDVYDMGQQAGKLIIKKIKQPNLQIQTYTTLTNLIPRASTKRNPNHKIKKL